jgi:serine/threonine protein kinase/formylglycine-generating enzyme required for sulfatase activity
MNAIEDDARSIFLAVLESAPDQRRSHLDRACGDNSELRARVEQLLSAHQAMGSIHGGFSVGPATIDEEQCIGDASPTQIGPYKLLEPIGEGGFGIVYMAEQVQPLRRRVALKIIKPGMDTRQVVARFEAERQALALMDHPNIAKVLDAGTTEEARNSEFGARSEEASPNSTPHPALRTPHSAGHPYFVMELVRGKPITEYCDEHQLSVRQRLELFVLVCNAVQHAHLKGIIHRDIKPSNVLVTEHDGTPVPKVIDFGVAKALSGQLTEKTIFTGFAQMIGTPLYMSPEQTDLSGFDVDTRSDIYSLGVLLYELLTGATPFEKEQLLKAGYDEMRRILREDEPAKPSTRLSTLGQMATTVATRRQTDVPSLVELCRGDLDWIAMKALEKDRRDRYESATALAADVQRYLADEPVLACPPTLGYRCRKFARRNRTALTTAALLAITVLVGGISLWQAWRASQAEFVGEIDRGRALTAEAKEKAYAQIPLVEALIREQQFQRAFKLLQNVEVAVPGDPRLDELRTECSWGFSIQSNPPGATVSRKPLDGAKEDWERLGTTPINELRLPRGTYHWRFEKPGYRTAENLTADLPPGSVRIKTILRVDMDEEGAAPSDMVRVRPQLPGFFWGMSQQNFTIPPYWLDRFEVTNRRFKRFVDEGGYRRAEFWAHTFEQDGNPLSWEEAMALFHDATGQPGPATWNNGSYPAGEEEFPVTGISWYEAAAFAKFDGKELPSIYHWNGATGRIFLAEAIIARSNFGSDGPERVGEYRGMSQCGAFDMAGNVKEWCFNSAGDGMRYVLGGAWDEERYMFATQDALPAIARPANVGFRCIKYLPGQDPPSYAFDECRLRTRDGPEEKPLSDREFQLVKGHFDYDKRKPFNVSVTHQDETAGWTHERVEIDAVYGNEPLIVNFYLPTRASPPYQPVIYWPGATGFFQPAISSPTAEKVAFLINSGRALVWPIYKGTYERRVEPNWEAEWKWEYVVQQVNDLRRTIDYLETRQEDFNVEAIGYYGYSWGAAHAVRGLAIEDRIKAAVLVDGGLPAPRSFDPSGRNPFEQPERDPIHYVPRITIPVLMLNGRHDITFPLRESQEPMYRLLGTDPARKRRVLSESSHVSALSHERIEETLNWFDQFLGLVSQKKDR